MIRLPSPVTVRLAAEELLCWAPQRPTLLRVVSGSAWVTQTGDGADHFLHAGDAPLTLRARARVLVGPRDARQPVFVCVSHPASR